VLLNNHRPIEATVTATSKTTTGTSTKTVFLCTLAVISGFGEICAMKSYGCFINMVTGATIRILMSAVTVGSNNAAAIHPTTTITTPFVPLGVMTGYLSGVVISRILQHRYHRHHPAVTEQPEISTIAPSTGGLGTTTGTAATATTSTSATKATLIPPWFVIPFVVLLFSMPELLTTLCQWRQLQLGTAAQVGGIVTAFYAMIHAVGYGFVAETVSDIVRTPTNVYVLTAHFTTIAKSIVDQFILRNSTAGTDTTKPSFTLVTTPQQRLSVQIVSSFSLGGIVALYMHRYCKFLLPFQHSVAGLLFASTFVWYYQRTMRHPPATRT
jgi:hypothetical protein